MRKYLRSIAKANMARLGYSRINRRMRNWRGMATKEATDKSIMEALGPAHVRQFKYKEQLKVAKRMERCKRRATA